MLRQGHCDEVLGHAADHSQHREGHHRFEREVPRVTAVLGSNRSGD